MSFMIWGEHCTECAAPECYQSCDLFEAAPRHLRCRRFRFWDLQEPEFSPSFRSYGTEIVFRQFKKWGVLASMGNTAMVPRSRIVWFERESRCRIAARWLNDAIGPLVARPDSG